MNLGAFLFYDSNQNYIFFVVMYINQDAIYFLSGADLREFALQLLDEKKAKQQVDELVPAGTVCKIFKVSKPTLWRWAKKGIVHPTKRGGKVYYRKSELTNLKEA